ncbi:MAG: Stealth CR1 domain-containing protein, partial [Candidatus Binatia bacterium]
MRNDVENLKSLTIGSVGSVISSPPHPQTEEIDAVYLWVDGGDPKFKNDFKTCLQTHGSSALP